MALNALRNWLITYDVADVRRLRRVHRFLRKHAVPVQYSVFATRATRMKVGIIRSGLERIVDAREDDVRIYPVPEPANLSVFGKRALPEGLRVIDGGSSLTLAPFALEDRRATIAQPAWHEGWPRFEGSVIACVDGKYGKPGYN